MFIKSHIVCHCFPFLCDQTLSSLSLYTPFYPCLLPLYDRIPLLIFVLSIFILALSVFRTVLSCFIIVLSIFKTVQSAFIPFLSVVRTVHSFLGLYFPPLSFFSLSLRLHSPSLGLYFPFYLSPYVFRTVLSTFILILFVVYLRSHL